MPVPYSRGKTVKWQHTFSFGDKEKKVIEELMEEEAPCSFNGAIRKIIIRYGKSKGYI